MEANYDEYYSTFPTKRGREDTEISDTIIKQQCIYQETSFPIFSFCPTSDDNTINNFVSPFELDAQNLLEILDQPNEEAQSRKAIKMDMLSMPKLIAYEQIQSEAQALHAFSIHSISMKAITTHLPIGSIRASGCHWLSIRYACGREIATRRAALICCFWGICIKIHVGVHCKRMKSNGSPYLMSDILVPESNPMYRILS